MGKEFPDANKGDIKRVVAEIENSHYVPHSKAELKTVLKKLYRWLRDSEEYPEEVRWIKTSSGKSGKKRLPEEILNTAEIKKLIKYAKNYRDRAFISLTYESGCRIGEILFVLIKHLEFDKYGVLVRVDGKTGPRRVRLVSSVHYLRDWLNVHPESENPEARLWMSYPGKPMTYAGICGMLQKTALRAGIKKRVNPHAFRHARATHLANHLTEAQMKVYFGWVRGSEMAAIYVHLSGRDVDQALLSKVYGLKLPERDQRKDQMRPVKCTRCGRDNPFTFKFCGLCGVPLNEKAAIEVIKQEQERTATDNVMDQLIQDSEFKEFMAQKIRELSAGRPQTHPQG
ncbi:MAG: tyrosine-type recombinase/integrase [Proteobacteria bacterium]|nr:tyrosine-type recombinase/integrase [Pseudomonadota bacterium]